MLRTRALQRETGGFTEFVPLPYVHMATPLYIQGKARQGPTFREALLMHAVARIAYADCIPNIQASWVKMGSHGAAQILNAGANDVGGTLIDENISRAAGASHGQAMDEAGFAEMVRLANAIDGGTRRLAQRTTLYGRVNASV
jgi:FO synthase